MVALPSSNCGRRLSHSGLWHTGRVEIVEENLTEGWFRDSLCPLGPSWYSRFFRQPDNGPHGRRQKMALPHMGRAPYAAGLRAFICGHTADRWLATTAQMI